VFQEDLFPDTSANVPAMSCAEWCSGMNKGPVLVSLNPAHAGKKSGIIRVGWLPGRVPLC